MGYLVDYLMFTMCSWDYWYVMVKLGYALVDKEKSSELRKCFDMHAKELDKLHCILKVIDAEDIWEKYAELWEVIEEKRSEIDECMKRDTSLSREICLGIFIADNIGLEAMGDRVRFVRRRQGGEEGEG